MSKKRFFFGFLPFFLVCFFSFLVSFAQKVKKADRTDFNQFSSALSLYYQTCTADNSFSSSFHNLLSPTDSVVVNPDEFSSALFLDSLMTVGPKPLVKTNGMEWTPFSILYSLPYASSKENFFFIDEQELVFEKDYFFLPANQSFVGESFVSIAVKEEGVPWFFSWEEWVKSQVNWNTAFNNFKNGNKFLLWQLFADFSKSMKEKGATGIVFHGKSFPFEFSSFFSPIGAVQQLDLPVVFMHEKSWNRFFPDSDGSHECKWRLQARTVSSVHKFSVGKIETGQKPWKVIFVDQDDFSTSVFSVWMPLLISAEEKKGSSYNYIFIHLSFDVFFGSSPDGNNYFKFGFPWEMNKRDMVMDKGVFEKESTVNELLWKTIKSSFGWKEVDLSSCVHLSLSKNVQPVYNGKTLNSTDLFSNLYTVYPKKLDSLIEEQKFRTSLFYQCKQVADLFIK